MALYWEELLSVVSKCPAEFVCMGGAVAMAAFASAVVLLVAYWSPPVLSLRSSCPDSFCLNQVLVPEFYFIYFPGL